MNLRDKLMIELACQNLVHRLTYLIDRHRDAEATALFTADAKWLRSGKLYTGAEEIMSSFAPSRDMIIRHYVSTITVHVSDGSSASSVSYYALCKGQDGADASKLPLPLPDVFSMGEWHDEFRLQDGEWRFSSRTVNRLFQAT